MSNELKEYKNGEAAAHQSMSAGKYPQHIEAYHTVERALEKANQAGNNPATYVSIVYDMGHSNDPGARMTDKDVQIAPGLTSLLGMTEEKLGQWFGGEQGAAHMQQIRDHLLLQKKLIDRQNRADALALVKQLRVQPNAARHHGFSAILNRYSSLPFFSEVAQDLQSSAPADEGPVGDSGESSSSSVETEDALRQQGLLP